MPSPTPLKFSIVTPSYKQPGWLKLCAASVADQRGAGLEVEHIVQDSLSGPEVAEAVRPFPLLRFVSEKDQGMYDAINRGWDKATGDILAWLNCDEQYLPGALEMAAAYFREHPETEILFADAIVVDGDCAYVCSREVLTPHLYHTQTCHLQTFSCSMFLRRGLLEKGFKLDPTWKDLGDAVFVMGLIRAQVRMASLGRFTSTFVDSGENMNLGPQAQKERIIFKAQAPAWVRVLTPVWKLLHRLRRWSHGHYRPGPFAYDIYTPSSPNRRVHVEVPHPTFYWAARMK
jgi:glycosyltransferase involved in cell wall biosynthesis